MTHPLRSSLPRRRPSAIIFALALLACVQSSAGAQESAALKLADGSAVQVFRFGPGSGGQLITLTHQYTRARTTPYVIRLNWRDQHGGGKSDVLAVQVRNRAQAMTAGRQAGLSLDLADRVLSAPAGLS